jgi:hypothetical protein
MELIEKIENAFAHRRIPTEVVEMEDRLQIDSDVEEALWFAGRNWREITRDDWEKHNCAVFFLSNEAFAYYLPSLLSLTVRDPEHPPDLVVDSLIHLLDRTPDVSQWDLAFASRFLRFSKEEYAVLKEWLVFASEIPSLNGYGISGSGPGDRFGRAFDNVNLLLEESERERPWGSPGSATAR